VAGYSTALITDEDRRRVLCSPASDFSLLAAMCERGKGERGGEELGLYGEGFKEAGELLGGVIVGSFWFPGREEGR
jgi:hypothetical protein